MTDAADGSAIGAVSDLIPLRYGGGMDAARILRHARLGAGLTLRDLAARSETSHATIAAYESGRVMPRVDTLDRILRAAGYDSGITLRHRPDATPAERVAKGRELLEVLDLAGRFPARHDPHLQFPVFPPAPAP